MDAPLLTVVAAGAVGALARYLIVVRMSSPPAATLLVNVLGSLALGAVSVAGDPTTVAIAGTGFLGAFTTFSTFAVQTIEVEHFGRRPALRYVFAMVVGCAIAAALGRLAAGVL